LSRYNLGKYSVEVLESKNGELAFSVDLANLFLGARVWEQKGLSQSVLLYQNKHFVTKKALQNFLQFSYSKSLKKIDSIKPRQGGFKGIPVWATTFEPQVIASAGLRGDWKLVEGQLAAALPSREYLGKNILVYHPETGKVVLVPVLDVGPWNTKDAWLKTGRRPQSEGGQDRRGRKTNLAGLDLSSQVWIELGVKSDRVKRYMYSAYVEFIPLESMELASNFQ